MNNKRMIALALSLLVMGTQSTAWADTETALPDGRKVLLTNKNCSTCPDPTIKLVDANGKVLSQLPAKERALVFSSAVVQDGRYFVTATTGGEGMVRVYDLNKKLMSSSIQPFGNAKTWGDLYALGGNEFAIVSGAKYTYLKDGYKKTKLVRYAINDGKLSELSRLYLDTPSIESLRKTSDGKLMSIDNYDSQVSEYELDGTLSRAVQFDKHARIRDLRQLKDGFFEALLSVGSNYFAVRVVDGSISYASLQQADQALSVEMKKGNNSYLGWSAGSFPVRFAGADSSEIHFMVPMPPTDYSAPLPYRVFATVADTATLTYQSANTETQGPLMISKLGRYSARGWPMVSRTLTYPNGVYEGDMEADPSGESDHYIIKTGTGRLTLTNGEQYEGEWKEGKRNGQGRFTFPNGDQYEGEWQEGERNGRGRYSYVGGNQYEGEFLKGEKNGRGRYSWPGKGYFDGGWIKGNREGYGERVYAGGQVERGVWSNDKLVKACTTDDQCLKLSGNVKFEREAIAVIPALSGAACANARVPNSRPLPHESTSFYGTCFGGTAATGVVIWKIRGEPVDMSCLSQGSYVSSSTVDAFEACGTYLPMIPNYCSTGNYKGQCVDAKPHGVGYMSSRGSTINMKRGMFSNGQLHGYGYSISKGGCGPAGCSGNLLNQVGWFDADVLQTSCSNFVDCLGNISGKTYSNFLSAPKSPELMTEAVRLRGLKTFDGAMEAFQIAGDRNDLKAAQSLAQSPTQKSQLELQLLRIAGLNKVFDLQARVQIGKQGVPINEHDKLLGFVRGVDSDLPVKVLWSIGAGNAALNPKAGTYRLSLTAGLNVQTSHRSCFLGFCSTRQDVDRYAKTIDIVLSSSGRYKASGEFELTLSGASAGTMFGVSSGKTLEDIQSVLQIESIRLEP